MPMIEDENLVNGYKVVTTESSSFGSDFDGSDLDSGLALDDSEEPPKE